MMPSSEITHRDLMIASPAPRAFTREGWLFELKYDGFRALASNAGGEARIVSRNGIDMAQIFPELAAELGAMPDLVIDSELVVLDDKGHPDFSKLQRRAKMRIPRVIAHAARTMPAALFAFDLLSLRGEDLRGKPLIERKGLLRELLRRPPLRTGQASAPCRICYLQHVEGAGEALYEMIEGEQLEGIVAKRADARYVRGRSSAWLKVKTGIARDREAVRLKHLKR